MPKVGMEPIRRQQLINATITSLAARGFGDTTVKTISAQAGMSAGIIHHYFGGKDGLLEATMRALLKGLAGNAVQKLKMSKTSEERVEAIIAANFAPEFYNPHSVVAWLVFWSHVPHSKAMKRLQRINAARVLSNLRYALKQIFNDQDAENIALGIAIFIDGLWVRSAVEDGQIAASKCQNMALDYFHTQMAVKPKRVSL